MSIEGQRSQGGMFSPGEALSAYKLNQLGTMAGYGQQFHSAGNLVAQGNFGTVDLSPYPADPYQDPNQFKVFHEKKGEDHWFTIEPGYCTVFDIQSFCNMDSYGKVTSSICGPDGAFTQTSSPNYGVEPQDLGYLDVYYVKGCNCYGAKRHPSKSSLLKENSFRPDNDPSSNYIIIFLYRSHPGTGTPKLAVTSFTKFRQYFMGQSNAAGHAAPLVYPTLFGCPPRMSSSIKMVPNTGGRGYVYEPGATSSYSYWWGLGVHIQVLAVYDKEKDVMAEVNKGHTWMTVPPVRTETSVDTSDEPRDFKFVNTGWHSYLWESPHANVPGLTFVNIPTDPDIPVKN